MSPQQLPVYVHQIQVVYAAIARKIQELLFFLNEVREGDSDKHTQELADRLTIFLSRLEQGVLRERILARKLSLGRRETFFALIQKELEEIRQLRTYVSLSKKKPTPAIIRKIHALSLTVEREIEQQEALAA